MNRKILGIVTIAVAFLFLLMPVSAMHTISTVQEKPAPSVIPQSEFVITLGENEEVTWKADYVIRDDDVAYVTMQTTVGSSENEGQPMSPPQPLVWFIASYKITAKNWWGLPLFTAVASALVRYSIWGICTHIIATSWARGWVWRYDADHMENDYEKGVGWDYGEVGWDVYFVDYWRRRTPMIHVWARHSLPPFNEGGGYLIWDP